MWVGEQTKCLVRLEPQSAPSLLGTFFNGNDADMYWGGGQNKAEASSTPKHAGASPTPVLPFRSPTIFSKNVIVKLCLSLGSIHKRNWVFRLFSQTPVHSPEQGWWRLPVAGRPVSFCCSTRSNSSTTTFCVRACALIGPSVPSCTALQTLCAHGYA